MKYKYKYIDKYKYKHKYKHIDKYKHKHKYKYKCIVLVCYASVVMPTERKPGVLSPPWAPNIHSSHSLERKGFEFGFGFGYLSFIWLQTFIKPIYLRATRKKQEFVPILFLPAWESLHTGSHLAHFILIDQLKDSRKGKDPEMKTFLCGSKKADADMPTHVLGRCNIRGHSPAL